MLIEKEETKRAERMKKKNVMLMLYEKRKV